MHNAWVDRFLAKIPEEPDEQNCWNWQGTIDPAGYGRFHVDQYDNKWPDLAHRVSYEYFRGPIAKGMTIDHLCRNRRCVNPDHLEVVTLRVNVRRGHGPVGRNARKTRCVRGHPLSGDNVRIDQNGNRHCRECQNAAMRRYHREHKSQISERRRRNYKARKLREAEVSP